MKISTTNSIVQPQYRTSDLGCVVALAVSGIPFTSLDRSNPSRVIFVFEDNQRLSKVVDQYWTGKLLVDAKSYSEQLKGVKARIYNG